MTVKVGDEYTIERRWMGRVDHRRVVTVTRVTAKRVYFDADWFALADKNRTVRPRYMNYWTIAIPVPGAAKDEAPRGEGE